MNTFLHKIDFSKINPAKLALFIFLALIILPSVLALLGVSYHSLTGKEEFFSHKESSFSRAHTNSYAPGYGGTHPGMSEGGYGGMDDAMGMGIGRGGVSMDMIIEPRPPYLDYALGDTEAYELREHNISYRVAHIEKMCTRISELKRSDAISFSNATTYDRGCNFSFKVEQSASEGVLAYLESLDPKEVNTSVHTLTPTLEAYDSQEEMLLSRLATLERTLTRAEDSYAELTALAERSGDAEALARIIESQIQTIDRLTREQVQIGNQLAALSRSEAETLDRVEYVFFSVSVIESAYVNWEDIREDWKRALQQFTTYLSQTFQHMTIGLLALMLGLVQLLLYLAVLVFVAKYTYRFGKKFWKAK